MILIGPLIMKASLEAKVNLVSLLRFLRTMALELLLMRRLTIVRMH